ncbi:MAG: hypothetical protein FWE51_01505 [Coriobacteriia bacterium]|nr:hypothetical protein [Coriobacteriia bacterium]
MTALSCYILDRKTLAVKARFQSYDWDISRDYLTNEKSSFVPFGTWEAQQGDFLVAKSSLLDWVSKSGNRRFKPFYTGVFDSFESEKIVCCDLYNLLNFEFVATRMTGTDVTGHLFALIMQNLINDTTKNIGDIEVSADNSAINWSYQPAEPPTATNMVTYFINAFRKYNVLWDVDYFEDSGIGALKMVTSVRHVARRISLKDNTSAFLDWDVYVDPGGFSEQNKLVIVNKKTVDMLAPMVMSTWYIRSDGEIVQVADEGVHRPTRDKVFIFDTTQQDQPTQLEVARAELSASNYSHEINFNMKKSNSLLDWHDLEMGMLANIVYNNDIFESIMTGYRVSSGSDLIGLRFGYVRSTLQQLLDDGS